MGLVAVEGMRFYAYHGFYKEEQKLGQTYLVDVYVHTNFEKASKKDALRETINYEVIYAHTKNEMAKPSKLLETVGTRIVQQLKKNFKSIEELRVRISKLNPPLGGAVARTFIEIHETYRAECAATKAKMLCYKDKNCWCTDLQISDYSLKKIKKKYKGCLSKKALQKYESPRR